MSATMHVVAVMLDGTKHETTGPYMVISDRVKFERLFNESIIDLRREARLEGEGRPNNLREEHTAWFCWQALTRAECPVGGFEDFLENVEDITIEKADAEVDPTDPAPLPGTSLS